MKRPSNGIATDAAHSTKNKLTRYRGIDLSTGRQIFLEDLGNQTVNIGEFLGVVAAVKYIIENDFHPRVIYTDSITAITWFNNKRTASGKRNTELEKAGVFLKVFSAEVDKIDVLHWKNDLWGETPADFGCK
ncbi:ribonuclease H family protein [Dysgonomonas termitidis]|uniref:Ribonuclease H n=1 Tax=Dysgonomonas termitidis TaxID=1516126 RepID=A0ABV9L569_9BACT